MLRTKSARVRRALDKRAPKLNEDGKKTLTLHGTKTSGVLNAVLSEIYHLKKGSAVKFSKKNENVRPFESGGEASLEFFSHKTDCSMFVFGSHSKKRPDNLVIGRTYDHHIYDLVEMGVENFRSLKLKSYPQDKKISPKEVSKPFIAFIGEGFESVEELKQLKEILLELFRGELKKSGTIVPKIELAGVGPSMDLVVRRHRLPDASLKKEATKSAPDHTKKKVKNVKGDPIEGTIGKIYMPDQKVGEKALPFIAKGMKRERREAKSKNEANHNVAKKQKGESEPEEA